MFRSILLVCALLVAISTPGWAGETQGVTATEIELLGFRHDTIDQLLHGRNVLDQSDHHAGPFGLLGASVENLAEVLPAGPSPSLELQLGPYHVVARAGVDPDTGQSQRLTGFLDGVGAQQSARAVA
jgi:hypothetical protein